MSLRADQWMMLGVVGVGVIAVSYMLRAPKDQSSPPPEGGTRPAPPAFPQNLAARAGPALLRTGQRVRGRADGMVDLGALGFTVTGSLVGSEAALQAGFLAAATEGGLPGSSYFEAVYNGPNGSVVLPPQIAVLYYSAAGTFPSIATA